MSGESKDSVGYRVAKKILFAIFLLFLAIVLFGVGGRLAFIIELPIRFFFGWMFHAWKAIPHLLGKWQEAVLPVGCLLMAAVIAHRFVRRWVIEKFPDRTWRVRYTASVISLLLLGSGAAIAASGVVHQMFWLAGGKVIESNRKADVTLAVSNGRQLMLALLEFQADNDRYPHSFEELVPEIFEYPESLRRLSWLHTRAGKVPEPWILLRPGSAATDSGDEPVLVSPVIVGEGKVVVGYADLTVRSIPLEKLAEVLGQTRAEKSEEGR